MITGLFIFGIGSVSRALAGSYNGSDGCWLQYCTPRRRPGVNHHRQRKEIHWEIHCRRSHARESCQFSTLRIIVAAVDPVRL